MTGFEFISYGEAGNKKDAQTAAAAMFCRFLRDEGVVPASELPPGLAATPGPVAVSPGAGTEQVACGVFVNSFGKLSLGRRCLEIKNHKQESVLAGSWFQEAAVCKLLPLRINTVTL